MKVSYVIATRTNLLLRCIGMSELMFRAPVNHLYAHLKIDRTKLAQKHHTYIRIIICAPFFGPYAERVLGSLNYVKKQVCRAS